MSTFSHNKKWNDLKILIAAASLTGTLALWNFFASISAQAGTIQTAKSVSELVSINRAVAPITVPTQPAIQGKLLLGGSAPQDRVIVQPSGGGGQPVTQTRSS